MSNKRIACELNRVSAVIDTFNSIDIILFYEEVEEDIEEFFRRERTPREIERYKKEVEQRIKYFQSKASEWNDKKFKAIKNQIYIGGQELLEKYGI